VPVKKKSKYYMAGYDVIAVSDAGRLSYRKLGPGQWRIRFKPTNVDLCEEAMESLTGWGFSPCDDKHFWNLVYGYDHAEKCLSEVLNFMREWTLKKVELAYCESVTFRKIIRRWQSVTSRPTVEEVVTSFAAELRQHSCC